jgi:transposase
MYFRLKQTKTTPVLQFVESFRNDEGQPRQRILLSLGNVSIPSELWHDLATEIENRLHDTPALLERNTEVLKWADIIMAELEKSGRMARVARLDRVEEICVKPGDISHHDTTQVGPSLVVKQAWDQLGMPQILEELGFNKTEIRDAAISVFNRLIEPCSEHALPQWVSTVALQELFEDRFGHLGDDRFHRISDRLLRYKKRIEAALAEKEADLFQLDRTIYLYDLSNSYFEGVCGKNELAKRGGKSKEKRNDAKQIAFGMVLDTQGFVIKHETFPGNMNDHPTLVKMVKSLDPQQESPLVVMDSGMASEENLLELRKLGWDYITVKKRPSRLAYDKMFEELSDFQVVKGREGKEPVYVKFLETQDENLVCCYSESRAAKETQILSKAETRFLVDLEKLKARIAAGRLKNPQKISESQGRLKERHRRIARYYEVSYQAESKTLKWNRIDEKYDQALQVVGGYVLRTTRKNLDKQTIWKIYITLTRVESGFKTLKSHLGIRPIYHQTAKRCRGHIFMTILAYHLLHWIEHSLRVRNEPRSWPSIRRLLETHAYTTIVLPTKQGQVYHIRKAGQPDSQQEKIYDLLNIPHRSLPIITSVI